MINKLKIENAIIDSWWISRESKDEDITISLQINISSGGAVIDYPLTKIKELFDLLHIDKIGELTGRPCVVLIEDKCMRTIGDFLYYNHPIGVYDHWIDYDKYKYEIDCIVLGKDIE